MEVETYTSKPAFTSPPSPYPPETLHSELETPDSVLHPPECHISSTSMTPLTVLDKFLTLECSRPTVEVRTDDKTETLLPPGGVNDQQNLGKDSAAVKVQKVYRSYRTRRRLADTAVVVEELWWQAIDFARLNHSTISFFNLPETAASRWSRISLNASKVGKGLSHDSKAQKLAFQHWIEAIDPRHRYGHNLHVYYDEWCQSNSGQPFFYWLDLGDGKNLDLSSCTRAKLRKQCIQYLGPQEREEYEYIIVEGKITHKLTNSLLDTTTGSSDKPKWIFVMSTCERLYVGEKKKGKFHHSSFLAGGATLAAGRLIVEDGVLKGISAYSGHYRPSDDRLDRLTEFLEEKGVDLGEVQIQRSDDAYSTDNYDDKLSHSASTNSCTEDPPTQQSRSVQLEISIPTNQVSSSELSLINNGNGLESLSSSSSKPGYKRTLSGGLQSPKAPVPKEAILERINSKKGASKSYQLGHRLSMKWSTGAGPRIGCVADYPTELRLQALEFNDLSPRYPCSPSTLNNLAAAAAGLTAFSSPTASGFAAASSPTASGFAAASSPTAATE